MVVVLAAVITIVVTANRARTGQTAHSSNPTPQPQHLQAWALDGRANGKWDYALNAWMFDDVLIVPTAINVIAYDRATGHERWKVETPETTGWPETGPVAFCGASTAITGNQVALSYGVRDPDSTFPRCAFVAILDVKAGRLGWQKQVAGPKDTISVPHTILAEIMGDTVVVGRDQQFFGYALSSGEQKWQSKASRADKDINCPVLDLQPAGKQAYGLLNCAYGTSDPPLTVVAIDPTTGQRTHTKDITNDDARLTKITGGAFVSSSPLVLLIRSTNENDIGGYLTFDENLDVKSVILAGGRKSPDRLDIGSLSHAPRGREYFRTIVGRNTLVTVTQPAQRTNSLVAFDLTSGRRLWAAPVGDATVQSPMTIDESTVIAAATSRDSGQKIMRVNLADGKIRSVDTYPNDPKDKSRGEECSFAWSDNRAYGIRQWDSPYTSMIFTVG